MKMCPGIFCSWKWHFRQSVALRSFSRRWLTEPWGEWQTVQPWRSCLVLVNQRAALLRVTLEAGFVSAQERKTAGFEFLLNICRRALDRDAFVHLMTIRAAHFAFEHRMMMRQCERCANFEVTLEASLR